MIFIKRIFPSDVSSYRVFALVLTLLFPIYFVVSPQMFVAERFIPYGGIIQILGLAWYGSWLIYWMRIPGESAKWRRRSWLVFTIVFFSQFLLGVFADSRFLMTGKLHLPIPAMIIAGPLYRQQLGFMTILFLSTIILTGAAWCSHLCYFGALDNYFAARRKKSTVNPVNYHVKYGTLLVIAGMALFFRWLHIPHAIALGSALAFGIIGLLLMLFLSRRSGRMIHCTVWCPVGTLVSRVRHLNPFRIEITPACTLCRKCTPHCQYNALRLEHLRMHTPGSTCTLCGDCISSCKHQAIQYRFFKLKPIAARRLYLTITVTLHIVFMSLGRI